MKKTTWAFINASVCVVVLNIFFISAPTQKQQKTFIPSKTHLYQPMKSFTKPWQPISSFSISGSVMSKSSYYGVLYRTPELDKKAGFLDEKIEGFLVKTNTLKRANLTTYH